MELIGLGSLEQLQQACRKEVEEAIEQKQFERRSQWAERLAVGNPAYVEAVRMQLGSREWKRDVMLTEIGCQLRDEKAAYGYISEGKKGRLSLQKHPVLAIVFLS
jgi:hypothetical protein